MNKIYKRIIMGIFNYIDTFFFISLGITFILILLLVFHFKQQIVTLEQKNDTMFEIINNIVKELTSMKQAIFGIQPVYQDDNINLNIQPTQCKHNVENKIVVSDDGNSEDNSDGEYISSDDESEEDSDDESNDDGENSPVKIINLALQEPISVNEIVSDIDNENQEYNDTYIVSNLKQELLNGNIQQDNIVVEKLENNTEDDNLVNNSNNDFKQNENNMEIYRKMTMQSLKTLVITKGLSTDPSKMKKNELLKLLEANIDE